MNSSREPFAKFGWLSELQEWIVQIISPFGLRLSGKYSQLNADPSFSLVRFETNGSAVWFKAVGEPNLHEFRITQALGEVMPGWVPTILAIHSQWNGWLALEVKGTTLDENQETQIWDSVASAWAKLQIQSVDKLTVLLDSGVTDLRLAALTSLAEPFLNAMLELMAQKTKTPPVVLLRKDLLLIQGELHKALSLYANLEMPDGLGNLDLNPGNVIVCKRECVFLD